MGSQPSIPGTAGGLDRHHPGAGALTEYVTHGPRLDEPLAVERGGATHYLQSDGLGSVIALTGADGVGAGRLDHDPFGNVEVASGLSTRFGYAGRDIDPTGLSYNRARYYVSFRQACMTAAGVPP